MDVGYGMELEIKMPKKKVTVKNVIELFPSGAFRCQKKKQQQQQKNIEIIS